MGMFGPGYTRHQYNEWLLTTVANLLYDDLAISSAGLLRGGAIAWVEVSMPDTITTPKAWRSARTCWPPRPLTDRSRPPMTVTVTVTDTVCDNTRELALSESGQEFKVKHSRNSHAQLGPARQALQMVHTLAEDFAQEIARLCRMEVTQSQWEAFLDAHIPRHDNDGTAGGRFRAPVPGRSRAASPSRTAGLM
jgi:phage/plasmid-like protein (TIGR03299 family)